MVQTLLLYTLHADFATKILFLCEKSEKASPPEGGDALSAYRSEYQPDRAFIVAQLDLLKFAAVFAVGHLR